MGRLLEKNHVRDLVLGKKAVNNYANSPGEGEAC